MRWNHDKEMELRYWWLGGQPAQVIAIIIDDGPRHRRLTKNAVMKKAAQLGLSKRGRIKDGDIVLSFHETLA